MDAPAPLRTSVRISLQRPHVGIRRRQSLERVGGMDAAAAPFPASVHPRVTLEHLQREIRRCPPSSLLARAEPASPRLSAPSIPPLSVVPSAVKAAVHHRRSSVVFLSYLKELSIDINLGGPAVSLIEYSVFCIH
uniref:Uncharacterized protein n=1 Tax=Triticum urartu TaxID=4572 RepID=A0A8R7TH47_TRIUA